MIKDVPMSEFALTIMRQKYSQDLAEGKEGWGNIAYRATKHVMRAVNFTMRDKLPQDICKAITDRKFIPAGRYLYASGRRRHQICNCFKGDTRVVTRHGTFPIVDLVGKAPILMTTKGWWVKSQVCEFGTQPLLKVTLSFAGLTKHIYATREHSWRLRKRTGKAKVKALTSELAPGDVLWSVYGFGIRRTPVSPAGVLHGIVFGDGSVPKDKHGFNMSNIRLCGEKNKDLLDIFQGY